MKVKVLAIFLFLLSIGTLANENDDFTYLDNLYKEKKFDLALTKSEEYLQKYPNSKYSNDLKDKLGKLYFLNKNYKKSIEIFKSLYINENKKSVKDSYAYYLARANANLSNEESMNFYLNSIDNKKIFNKTQYEAGVALLSAGNNEGAAKLFKQVVIRKGEYSDEALFNLGVANYNLNKYQESFNILNEYSQKNKNSNFEMITYLKGSSLYKNNSNLKKEYLKKNNNCFFRNENEHNSNQNIDINKLINVNENNKKPSKAGMKMRHERKPARA